MTTNDRAVVSGRSTQLLGGISAARAQQIGAGISGATRKKQQREAADG
ncbi:hypothetical protein ABT167_39630 [Streptomyces sp. NPDC001792]